MKNTLIQFIIFSIILSVAPSVNAIDVDDSQLSKVAQSYVQNVDFDIKILESKKLHPELSDLTRNEVVVLIIAKTKKSLGKRLLHIEGFLHFNGTKRNFKSSLMLINGKVVDIQKMNFPYHPKLKFTKMTITDISVK